MKKYSLMMIAALTFAIVAGTQTVSAQVRGPLDLKVGFSFYAGNTELPAGSYTIRVVDDSEPNVLEVRSADLKTSVMFAVNSVTADSPPAKSQVVFKKFGDREILSEIWEQGNTSGAQVEESLHEKRAAKSGATPAKHPVEVTSKKTAKP